MPAVGQEDGEASGGTTGILLAGAWLAWATFCLLGGIAMSVRGWADAATVLGAVGWREVLRAHPVEAFMAHAQVLIIALGLAVAWAGAGAPILSWLGAPFIRGWERVVLALLLGFAMLGAALLGIALAGLFMPVVVMVVALVGLALPCARTAVVTMTQARLPLPATNRGWLMLGLIPAVIPILAALTPDTHMDTYTYHLALPEQTLRVHKFTAEGLSLARGYPLVAELMYSTTLISGRDAVAHWLNYLIFGGAMCLLAGWVSRMAGPAAGWLAVGATATMGLVVQLGMVAKNDLVAAAYPVAGIVCLARGWPGIAAALFGCGGAVKWNCLLFAALAVPAFWRPRHRGFISWMFLLACPVLPWLLKSWLWTGDPVWPVLSHWLPGALWDDSSQASMTIVRRPWGGLEEALLSAPPALIHGLVSEAPGLAILIPLALFGTTQARGIAWFAVAGLIGCAVAMPFEWIRLALPAIILLAAAASATAVGIAANWRGRGRSAAAAIAALAVWLPVGGFVVSADPVHRLPTLTAAWSEDRFLAESLTTYRTVADQLSNVLGGSRLIGFGDIRHYRLPGRFLEEVCYGRTWAWTVAHENMTPERIRTRWRQLGVRYALENFVVEGLPHTDAAPFTWDDRMLSVWRLFVGRYLTIAVRAPAEDSRNGGFVIWTVRGRPLDCEPAWLPYLPGMDSILDEVTRHGLDGNAEGWLAAARALARRVPRVDFVDSLVGVGYYSFGRYAEAYRALLPGLLHGTIADDNYWMAGTSAAMLGHGAAAYWCFERAAEFDLDHRSEALRALERLREVGVDTGRLSAFTADANAEAGLP